VVINPEIEKPGVVVKITEEPEVVKPSGGGSRWPLFFIILVLAVAVICFLRCKRLCCFAKEPWQEKPMGLGTSNGEVELTSGIDPSDDEYPFKKKNFIPSETTLPRPVKITHSLVITRKLWKLMVVVHTALAVLCLTYTIVWTMDRSVRHFTWHVVEVPSKISADIRAMGEALDR
jgi:hypothetical protein